MRRTRNALFGVLGVGYASFLSSVVQRVAAEVTMASDSLDRMETFAAFVMWFALVSLAVTVTQIVFLILFARSVRDTRAASLASATWMLTIVVSVLSWGGTYLARDLVAPGEPLILTALTAMTSVLYWIQLGLFCGAVYRLVGDRGAPLHLAYGVGMVGSSVGMYVVGRLFRELVMRPSWEAGEPPVAEWVTALADWSSWGLHLLWLVALTGLVVGATRRLRTAPQTLRQVFD